MKSIKRIIMTILVIVMTISLATPVTTEAASKPRLNRSKATLIITSSDKHPTVILSVYGTSKKPKWSTSNKKVATVKNGEVMAKKAGKATITCKVAGKKLTCVVIVKDKRKVFSVPTISASKKCKHNWAEHWAVFKKKGEIPLWWGDPQICNCNIFMSIEDKSAHQTPIIMHKMTLSSDEAKIGLHGTCARATCNLKRTNSVVKYNIRADYVDYLYCTKCDGRMTTKDLPDNYVQKN